MVAAAEYGGIGRDQHLTQRPASVAHIEEMARALRALHEPGALWEIRAPRVPNQGTVSGYFDDPDICARMIATQLDPTAPAVYVTLNPVTRDAQPRAYNRLLPNAKTTTPDSEITARHNLLIDCDPIRPSGVSATDAEHDAAVNRAEAIRAALTSMGWPAPILADSGNGAHLIYRLADLANDSDTRDLIDRTLHELARRFDDTAVKVDTVVGNAGRIVKLYGTTARKGDDTQERPHRRSHLLDVPATLHALTRDHLAAFCPPRASRPSEPHRPRDGYTGPAHITDVKAWLDALGVTYREKSPTADGARRYELRDCPWGEHGQWKCVVLWRPNGSIAVSCVHADHAGRGLRDFRDTLEPGWLTTASRRTAPPPPPPTDDDTWEDVPPGADVPPGDGTKTPPFSGDQHYTDMGNAARLLARHGQDLRYCYSWKNWLTWDGARWVTDDTGCVVTLAKHTIRAMYAEASEIDDPQERKQLAAHATRSEGVTKVKAMITMAENEVPIVPDALDTNEWLLNVKNGTLDLRTGKLHPHRRENLLTKLAPVAYDPQATCPTWLAFLDSVMNGNQDLVAFLQRAIGYSLTGSTREHVLFLLHGPTRAGKSTVINTIQAILGLDNYATVVSPAALIAKETKGGSEADENIASMRGARFVSAVETGEGRRLAETLVKQLTGGDAITTRFNYGHNFTFTPTFKLFLATNHKPVIRGDDGAIWARMRLIPFTVSFLGREDKTLDAKLAQELPGILTWAVQGCLAWQRDGLAAPADVTNATSAYRVQMDDMGTFLRDRCVVETKASITGKALYAAYDEWCKEVGEKAVAQRRFNNQLQERGVFEYKRGHANVLTWYGLRLRHEDEPIDPDDAVTQVTTVTDFSTLSHEEKIVKKCAEHGKDSNPNLQSNPQADSAETPFADATTTADEPPPTPCPSCHKRLWSHRRDGRAGWVCRVCHSQNAL